jgi:hypothetical protein
MKPFSSQRNRTDPLFQKYLDNNNIYYRAENDGSGGLNFNIPNPEDCLALRLKFVIEETDRAIYVDMDEYE